MAHPRLCHVCLSILPALMAGCDTTSAGDLMVVRFAAYATPVEVDTVCENGGCLGDEELTVTLAFDPAEFTPADEVVEFLQYRVDYDLTRVKGEVPYFASPVALFVYPDQTTSFVLHAAGQAQRDYVFEAVGDRQVDGVALLTLAGYDSQNEQVFLEADFDIRFGDFITELDQPEGGSGDESDAGAD